MQRVARILGILAKPLAALATAVGLMLLLAMLAGVFTPKVDVTPSTSHRTRDLRGPVAEVRLIRRPRVETAVGTVKAVHEASVASKLLARVTEVNVQAGQTVAEGDVLVRLDDADLEARLQQAKATVSSAQAAAERATTEFERAHSLLARKAISQAEFDRADTTVKTAQAELQRAQRMVDEAAATLEFATIRAPLSGVVIDKRVEPGDTATPGQVLVTLYEPDRMQLVADVRESLALRLKVGDRIRAQLDALEHHCLATIREIVPLAESASRSFTVKVTGPCPPGVYSGMFGRISIPLEDEQIVAVPAEAIVHVGQLTLADVVVGDVVQRRSVRLGRPLEAGYEVLAGLSPGERVALHLASKPGAQQ